MKKKKNALFAFLASPRGIPSLECVREKTRKDRYEVMRDIVNELVHGPMENHKTHKVPGGEKRGRTATRLQTPCWKLGANSQSQRSKNPTA